MRTKFLATLVATASLLALQASAFAQTAALPQTLTQDDLHPAAPSTSQVAPTGRPLYDQMSPQQFNAVGDYRNGNVSVDSAAHGGIGH
jgi:hypothetical protein